MPAGPAGSGGGAGNVRAGGAYYEVVGKDGLSKTLTALQGKVSAFRSVLSRVGGPVAVAVATGVGLAKAWDEVMGYSRTFRMEMEKSAVLTSELAKSMDRITGERREWIDAIADPKQKIPALTEEISRLERELSAVDSAAEAARKEIYDLGKNYMPKNLLDKAIGTHQGYVDEKQKGLDDNVAKAAKLRDYLYGARTELRRILNPEQDPKLFGDIQQATKQMLDAFEALGKTPAQALEQRFRDRGADDKQLANFRGAAASLESGQKVADVRKQFDDLRDRLDKELQTLRNTRPLRSMADVADSAEEMAIRGIEQDAKKLIPAFADQMGGILRDLASGVNEEKLKGKVRNDLAEMKKKLANDQLFEGLTPDQRAAAELAQLAGQLGRGFADEVRGAIRDLPIIDPGAPIRANLSLASAKQQFGYGDTVAKQQTELLEKLLNGDGEFPDKIGKAVAGAMTFK